MNCELSLTILEYKPNYLYISLYTPSTLSEASHNFLTIVHTDPSTFAYNYAKPSTQNRVLFLETLCNGMLYLSNLLLIPILFHLKEIHENYVQ